jgi:MFS transporter, DHA2 family, multidrug resistance protein
MGFPVITAGLILGPRGIGTMIAMIIVGRVISKLDARYLVLLGLILTIWVLWEMAGYTPDVSQFTLIMNGVVQGLGLGFMFVPLSTITFVTLPAEFRTQGTALFSLTRNIGSSIGISLVSFLLVRNTQIVHASLAEHVTPYNMALRIPQVAAHWNIGSTTGLATLNSLITRQATVIAYNDDFKLMMYVAIFAIPGLLLLRGPKKSEEPVEVILE